MSYQGNSTSRTMNNHSNAVTKKESDNSPENKLKVAKDCGLNDRKFKIAVIKKLNKVKNTQKGNLMRSGVKLMNAMSTLPRRLKL